MHSEIWDHLASGSLLERVDALREEFRNAHPFPHVVIDDFLPPGVVEAVRSEFSEPGAMGTQFDEPLEVKSAENRWERLGPATREVLSALNSELAIRLLERLTGIDGLVSDPYLWGAGQHQIREGGKLGVHVDFNVHPQMKLERRLNLLWYLNPEWQEEWGGHLELWDTDMSACVTSIAPVANRGVVFATTDTSFHGHPDGLRTPSDVTRKSLALYYYTNTLSPEEYEFDKQTTLFQARPGTADRTRAPLRARAMGLAREISPPILRRALRRRRAALHH